MKKLVAVLAIALPLAACGTPETESATDAGTQQTDAGQQQQTGCGTVPNSGTDAPEVAGTGTMPSPQGGTIVDGTYFLTRFEIYPPGSVDAYKRRHALKFENGKVESVTSRDGSPEQRNSGTFTTSGTNLVMTVDCPGAGSVTKGYTATATEFWMFESDEIHVYTKQ